MDNDRDYVLQESSLENPPTQEPAAPTPHTSRFDKFRKPLLIAAPLLLLTGLGVSAALLIGEDKSEEKPVTRITIQTQSLDEGTLTKLRTQNGTGETQQLLVISPDSSFENTVRIQKTLQTDSDVNILG